MILPAALLLAEAADFTAVDVLHEYVSFLGSFFIVGAAAFYFLLLRPSFGRNADAMRVASRSAARIGIVGALLRLLTIGMSVSTSMMAKQLSLADALTRSPALIIGEIVTLVTLIAFAAAASASRDAIAIWVLAGVATLVIAFRDVFSRGLQIKALVNPLHVFAASMWIGTLFVLVVAGITTAMSGAFATSDRGPAVATIVNRFSTLALWSAGVLVLTGVTTAWIHLGAVSALWTSTYGQTLIVKLCLVAVVFTVGAYNNKRLMPSLGTEAAATSLHRSAKWEIGIASVVLIVTAVLVNLPAPAEHMAH
ncbi:MAG: CopD family protein [Gemmatimonadaceae bacterium]